MENSEKAKDEVSSPQDISTKEKLAAALRIPKTDVPIEVKGFPRVTDSEFRLACHDIAEVLAGHWRFKLQVIGAIIVLFFAIAVAGFGLLGLTIKDTANDEIKQAKEETDKEIRDQFQTEKITSTIEKVASENASDLIQKSIQPAIDSSQKTLSDFNQHLKEQQASADKELATFREELAKLEKRNEITGLADQAIEGGDVTAFHKLRDMASGSTPPVGAEAELFRVFEAYSIFSPQRWVGVKLNPAAINPAKAKEEDLDTNDLLTLIAEPDVSAPARGRASELLLKVAKVGSYSTAKSLVQDIEKENHLEVIRRLTNVFVRVAPSFVAPGDIDGQGVLDWWKTHESDVQKADTDKK